MEPEHRPSGLRGGAPDELTGTHPNSLRAVPRCAHKVRRGAGIAPGMAAELSASREALH